MTMDRLSENRGRKERFFRYVLRRQPCFYVLLANIVCLIFLITVCVLLYDAAVRFSKANAIFIIEDEIVRDSFKGEIVFTHCPYKPRPPNWVDEWDFSLCSSNCGPSAIAHRTFKLIRGVSDDEAICQDLVETVLCSDRVSKCDAETRYQNSCPGLKGTSLISVILNSDRIGPLMTADELKNRLGEQIRANELVVHCPKCYARSTYFKDTANNCKRLVGTKPGGDGWPYWAQKCDGAMYDKSSKKC